MTFALITLLSALSLAAVADWFSIVGFMSIYAAAPMHALVMGTVLALAKLVTTSWVYRNWVYADWKFKTPLIGFVIALMLITSIGTYGFLTKSHLDQTSGTIDNAAKVGRLDDQIGREKLLIIDHEKIINQLDAAVNSYIGKDRVDKSVSVRKSQDPQRKQLRSDIESSQKRIDLYSDEKLKLQSEVRKQELDVGPIRYIAELFYGASADTAKNIESAIQIFTLLIVITLDPLAVVLLVAANHTLLRLKSEKEVKVIPEPVIPEPLPVIPEPLPVIPEPLPVIPEPVIPEPLRTQVDKSGAKLSTSYVSTGIDIPVVGVNSFLQEFNGSGTHFVPQKVNDDNKHDTDQHIPTISSNRHKYPAVMSWITEFKRH